MTPTFTSPDAALAALLDRLRPVETESVGLPHAAGRTLARPVTTDRPSPPCDVSAMDGYAVRLADMAARGGEIPVAGEALIGRPPATLEPATVLRVFTGAPVPAGAEAIIPREAVQELGDRIRVPAGLNVPAGQYIRCAGENAPAGETVLPAGALLTPAALAAAASFGAGRLVVHRRLRVAVLVTGDELRSAEESVEPWQIRDANGPALAAFLAALPWVERHGATGLHTRRVADDLPAIEAALAEALAAADVVLVTGGVSVGRYDHVPEAVRRAGAEVVFHGLPMRPGKPVLAAVGPRGQAVFGLPGNPQAVLVGSRRLVLPALAQRAGLAACPPPEIVKVVEPDARTLDLWWFRPAQRAGPGRVALVPSVGSGDVVAAARSDGFIELPPGASGPGPWAFYAWNA